MRGVTLFEIADDQIVARRLYMEDVERDAAGIEQAVEALSVAIQPGWLGVRAGSGAGVAGEGLVSDLVRPAWRVALVTDRRL